MRLGDIPQLTSDECWPISKCHQASGGIGVIRIVISGHVSISRKQLTSTATAREVSIPLASQHFHFLFFIFFGSTNFSVLNQTN